MTAQTLILSDPYWLTFFVALIWATFALISDSEHRYVLAVSRFVFFPFWLVTLIFLACFSGLTLKEYLTLRARNTFRQVHSTAGLAPTNAFNLQPSYSSPPPNYVERGGNFATLSDIHHD